MIDGSAVPNGNKVAYHDFLRQAYLINTKYMKDLIEHAAVDDKARGRLRFFARQILDALSPVELSRH